MQITYKVFRARLNYPDSTDKDTFTFCCSNCTEIRLRKMIKNGDLNMDILELIHETEDRNEARNMADAEF